METTQTITYLLQHVASVLDRQIDQILQEQLGIGQAQFRVLQVLQKNGAQSQRQLADHLGQTEASVSRQTKLLTDRGLIISHVNPNSRREHVSALAVKGAKIADAAQQAIDKYTQGFYTQLSEKSQKQLVESLVTAHVWTCQTGKITSCDHPFHI